MLFSCLLTLAQNVDIDTLPKTLDYIMNGGIAVVVFVIWWFTFRYMIKQHDKTIEAYELLVKETKKEYQELVKETKAEHRQVINDFITVVKEQMELNSYTSGILARIETKMEELLRK
jgi:hypothetical protein